MTTNKVTGGDAVRSAKLVGEGPIRAIVCHGWMGDHRLFEPLFGLVDKKAFSFAFLDCRGYGTRRGEAGGFTVGEIASDIVALADNLGWQSFHVVGHSMAGMAAQRLMVDIPERLRSAVLVAPVPASGAKIDSQRLALLLNALTNPEARRALINANTGNKQPDSWLNHVLAISLESASAKVLESYMQSWASTDFASEAKDSKVPVLLVVGEIDPGAPQARMQETIMTWYPNAELSIIAETGHYPMQEKPQILIDILASHLLKSSHSSSENAVRGSM